MTGRTSSDDDMIREQQEKDLGHSERPSDAGAGTSNSKDDDRDKDRQPGVSNAQEHGTLSPSGNAGADPDTAVDPVPDGSADPRV